jgi:hypothetical protein
MEEQKNLNNLPAGQMMATPKNIPTVAGVMIILSVAVIVGAGLYYILQTYSPTDYSSRAVISGKSLKSKTETLETEEEETAVPIQAAEEKNQEAAGSAFDFDYELKKLDDQNNSVNPDDFNENEMSDVNIGL